MAKCRQCGRDAGLLAELCDVCAQAPREGVEQQVADRKRTEIQADQPTAHPISGQQSQTTPKGSSASQRIDEQIKAINGDYLVIPFIGKIKSGFFSSENAETVSRQLQSLINWYSQQGWEFHTITKVGIEVTPGCLANLFGATTSYITFDQVVFRRCRQ